METSKTDSHTTQPANPSDQLLQTSKADRILYLGPDLSFSYAAAHAVFPDSTRTLVQCAGFVDIFSRLQTSSQKTTAHEDGCDEYAIVPVVNSTNGPVVPVVDLIRRCGDGTLLQQVRDRGVKGLEVPVSTTLDDASATASESAPAGLDTAQQTPMPNEPPSIYPNITLKHPYTYDLAVHHYLYVHPTCPLPSIDPPTGTPTPDLPTNFFHLITSLHTHPQVWTQCSRFLQTHFPSPSPESKPSSATTRHDHPSTSAASLYIAQHGSQDAAGNHHSFPAAICSRLAGEARGLKCIAAHIEDDTAGNATTFVILGVEGKGA